MGALRQKIIILHGWAYSSEKWKPFVGMLETFGFEIEIPNIPGLTGEIDKPWLLDDYVRWLDQYLANEKSSIVLVGHSNGGRIAIAFAARYPDKLTHLILIDSAGIYHNELFIRFKRYFFGMLAPFGKYFSKIVFIRKLFYKIIQARDYGEANPIMKKTMANLISVDLREQLGNIKTPTDIIWGGMDKITPLEDGMLMKQLVNGSTLHIIDSAKHSPQFTDPERVVDIIKNVITDHANI